MQELIGFKSVVSIIILPVQTRDPLGISVPNTVIPHKLFMILHFFEALFVLSFFYAAVQTSD